MAESIAAGVVNPLTSFMLDPLARQVSYVVKVGEKVKVLELKMADLKNLSNDIRNEVEEAEKEVNQTRRCTQLLQGWLDRVRPMEKEVSDIKIKYEKLGRWCFGRCPGDVISMYKIGRNTTRKLAEVTDLYQKLDEAKKSGNLTQKVPSPSGQDMPGTSNLVAIKSNLSEVLGYLANGVGVVGIFGMGGVGKTTLLKSVNNSILSRGGNISSNSGAVVAADNVDEKRLHFDYVIWVTVSRDNAEVQRLQCDIAKQLNLKLPNDDKNSWASEISNFLGNKRFALLLDDIWKRLDLSRIGIPDVGEGRAVVLTTRSEAVCGDMEVERKVKVGVLKTKDAWRLFREKAKNEHIKSDPVIENLARQIAGECKGLPLALITMGRAMSTKKTIGEWRYALKALKDSKLAVAIPEEDADTTVASLKFSYDNLIDEKTKQCFLYCALFPEDHCIPKKKLIECLLGHGVIDSKNFSDIGEMYDYGDNLIGNLTSACLLEPTQMNPLFTMVEDDFLKMHDIIRDMALWIANDCQMDNNKWIVRAGLRHKEPLKKTDNWELADRLSLMMNDMRTLPEPKKSCPNLSTLMIQGNMFLERIPKIFQHFPSLTYLDMSSTGINKFPEEVTMLVQLQYLNLSNTRIESLSSDLKNLKELRYLILGSCRLLEDIPPESISSLPSLQVLDLSETEITFDLSIVHPMDTKVEELKRLKGRRIKALGLRVKLREFSFLDECVNHTTIWKLNVDGCPSDSCPVRDTLTMGKDIEDLNLTNFGSLQELTIWSDDQDGHFPRLCRITLENLRRLEKIMWKMPTTSLEMFPKLTSIMIDCCQMSDISWVRHATRLTFLNITSCTELSNIITSDENDCRPSITFSNLRMIWLEKLPQLSNIYEGTIYCPSLQELFVRRCNDLTRLPFNFQSQITNNGPLRIYGMSKWWEALKWEDDNIKSQLEPFRPKTSDGRNYMPISVD